MSQPTFESIPFESFSNELDTLITAVGNRLDREWPTRFSVHPGAQSVIISLIKVSENTYRTVRFIAADKPENLARKREYALAISPLARTLLEALFSTVFLFGDLPKRTRWYYQAGWRELHDDYTRLRQTYGTDPSWSVWLDEQAAFLDKTKLRWGITDAEAENPAKLRKWPIPSGMIRYSNLAAGRKEYLEYLNDWFYKTLSQDVHLSWPGLTRQSFALVPYNDAAARGWMLDKHKSDLVITCVTLILSLVSELELEFRFGYKERIQYVWGVITSVNGAAKEVYERFYAQLFGI